MDFDSDVLDRHDKADLLMIMNEVYFGKTEDIQAIEHQLHLFRRFYLDGTRLPKNDQHLLKLNRMIAKFFGFGSFSLIVAFDPIPGAMTMPISYDLDTASKESGYIVDINTYKFKKKTNYNCVVLMTTGLIFNSHFSTEEIMACLLYEIGYAFFGCFSHSNAILSNIYSATWIVNTIVSVMISIRQAFMTGKLVHNSLSKEVLDDVLKNPKTAEVFKTLTDQEKAKALDAFLKKTGKDQIIDRTALGSALSEGISGIINIMMNSPIYMAFQKRFHQEVESRPNNAERSVLIGFKHYLNLGFKYFGANMAYINEVLTNLIVRKMDFLSSLNLFELFLPYKEFIQNAFNPLTWISIPIMYKAERAAQNFPTMYGYGPAAVSYFDKMRSKDKFSLVREINKKTPLVSIVTDIILLPSKILNAPFNPSPNQISMILDQIKLLETELEKTDLSPETRIVLAKDVAKCQKAVKDLTTCNSKVAMHPEVCKLFFNRVLYRLTGGIDLKDVLFDDPSKFLEYDKNAKSKFTTKKGV